LTFSFLYKVFFLKKKLKKIPMVRTPTGQKKNKNKKAKKKGEGGVA